MGYYEEQQQAAARERQSVRMGNADPNSLTTISGNMAWKAQQQYTSSSSSWSSGPTYDAFPTYGGSDSVDPYASAGLPQSQPRSAPRAPRPHVPDWTDRAMQRIPHSVLVVCAIIGGLIGLAAGASSGGATAILYGLFGAGAGLLALPAAIKLLQLALRALAVAAVIGVFAFILWALAHTGK